MTVTTNGGHSHTYACKCLNVRINSLPAPEEATPTEKDYSKLYVGDEGISVAHNQLTLRTRSRAKEEKHGDDTILTRYMSLTCLVCQTLVYRVLQVITPDIDYGEGPVPPTEDWVESELLKTPSGWIEVYQDCISGDDISKAETSQLYSPTFCIVLPSGGSSSSSAAPSYPAPSPSDPSPEQQKHLPALPPLFLAPPFTPSHSVFRHVSSVASEVSSKLREEAEEYLAKVVRDKVAELEAAENNLRAEVEAIWAQWKQAISKAEQEANEKKRNRNNNRQSGNFSGPTSPTSPGQGNGLPASVRITSFVPQGSPNRSTTSASVSRTTTSALSASLATSTFHHPKALAERNGSTSGTASANGSRTSPQRQGTSTEPTTPSTQRARSPATASSRTLAMNIPTEAVSIREAYRRNMDESKDIATSFKYVMEMDQLAGQAALVDDASLIPVNTVPSVEDVPRGRSPKSAIKRVSIGEPSGSGTNSQQADVSKNENGKLEEKKPEAKIKEDAAPTVDSPSKGKRKVTFVVNPDVTIIDDEPTRESETKKDASVGEEAAVFDFENESGEREGDIIDPLDHRNVNTSEPTTPIEPIQAPRRPPRVKKTDMSGLPSSLSTLRPASLPMPSTMRPAIPEDRHSEKKLELTPTSVDTVRDEKVDHALEDSSAEDPDEEMDSREAEILKLVAAHTPSHRSAWKKNSKAWQLFVSRQGKKKRKAVDRIPEEDEDSTSSRAGYYDESDETTESDDKQPDPFVPLATSAPIPIAPIGQGRNFGVHSYQTKTSLSDRPGVLVPALRRSSTALRKASYAERDRLRSIDPGIVDFADEDEEDDDDDDLDLTDGANAQLGGRARRQALKILQARDSVPAAGMWRSLA